jgi:transposase
MARPRLTLQPHLSSAALKERYRRQRDAKEGRRWHALWLVSTGRSAQEAAAAVGFDVSWVRAIIRRYNAAGPDGVVDGHRARPGGPAPRLTPAQQDALRAALAADPPHGGLWSGPQVAQWITTRTGRPTCPQVGWRYLRRLGHTPQVPRPQHTAAAPPEERAAFKQSWPSR